MLGVLLAKEGDGDQGDAGDQEEDLAEGVILGLHSDWVLVHILRTSLIVQSWQQNRLETDYHGFQKIFKS